MSPSDSTRDSTLDLAGFFGADPGWTQTFAVFIPDTDRDRQPIPDYPGWVTAAMTLLRDINGGVTALAEAEGQWRNRADGVVVEERTRIVFSYIDNEPFVQRLAELREFLYRFGRETRQDTVAFEFDNHLFFIPRDRYDPHLPGDPP